MKKLNMLRVWICIGLLGAGTGYAQDATPPPDDADAAETVVPADGAPAAVLDDREKTSMDVVAGYLKMGGFVLWIHIAMSILALAVIIERFTNLRKERIVPDELVARATALWQEKKDEELARLCADDGSIFSRVIGMLVGQRNNPDVAQVKMFAEDKASRELRLEARRAGLISTIANLAPLVGLFGTVLGLLRAFQTVAEVGEMGDPAVLANDIGMALITTVSGLALAMPALFVYNQLRSRINLFAVMLEEEVFAFVNACFVNKG